MAEIKITKQNFDQEVLQSEAPILLDFWATWCGPCQMMGKVIEDYLKTHQDFKVGKVNVDEEMALAMQFGIESIPTLLLFKDGAVVKKSIGYLNPDQFENFVK